MLRIVFPAATLRLGGLEIRRAQAAKRLGKQRSFGYVLSVPRCPLRLTRAVLIGISTAKAPLCQRKSAQLPHSQEAGYEMSGLQYPAREPA